VRLSKAIEFLGCVCYCGGKLAGRVGGEASLWQRIEGEPWQPHAVTLADHDTSSHASIGALGADDAHFDAPDLAGRALKLA
jgi:hypothetical protein